MKRKLLAFTAILTLTVLAFGTVFSVSANTTGNGSCGQGVTWEFRDGMLTVSGEGNMDDYSSFSETPWKDYAAQITMIMINGEDNSNVENIGANAFAGCTNLTTVLANDLTKIGTSAFEGCKLLDLVQISTDGSLQIGEYAFSGCESLTSSDLHLPNSISSIGKYAFTDCESLTEFVIPEGITAVAESLFSGCTGLTKVVIPNSVAFIGASAFKDCTALTHLVYCGTEQGWETITKADGWNTGAGEYVFRYHDCSSNTAVYGGNCSVCGQSIGATDTLHRWDEGRISQEPTHFQVGYKIFSCLDCEKTRAESIDTTAEHTYGDWTYDNETKHKRSCVCGDEQTEDHSGEWKKHNAAQHKMVCVCGYTKYADHSWNTGEITTPATHTSVGVKTYTCSSCNETKTEDIEKLPDHTYSNWTYYNETQHKKSCNCGDEKFLDHTWNNGVVTSQPTHTEYGVKTYTCSDCGGTKTEDIDKLPEHTYGNWIKYNDAQHKKVCACGDEQYGDHTWNNGEVTAEPTHLVVGERTYVCSDCGETKTEEIPKLTEHTYSDVWEKHNAAKHKKVCACGDEIYEDHAWDEGEVTKESTHLETGSSKHACLVCGESKTETIAKLTEHTYSEWTKHNETQHKKTCACGDVQYVDHRWNDGEVTKAATHMSEGKMLHTCADCGATMTVAIEKSTEHTFGKWTQHDDSQHKRSCSCGAVMHMDHDYEKWTLITPATAEEAGERSKTCKVCGYVLTESIPALEKKPEGMGTGGVIGVTVSLTVLLGVGGFWFASPELMGNGVQVSKKKKTSLKQESEAEAPDDSGDLED